MTQIVGSTITISISCTRKVSGVSQAYDPETLVISILRSDGGEDTYTYGGSDAGDEYVTKQSTGQYVLVYEVPAGVSSLSIQSKTTDTSLGSTWPSKSEPVTLQVAGDRHKYQDQSPA